MTHQNPETELIQRTIPRHVAIILDGNGRWAEKNRLPRIAGHRRGVIAVRNVVQACAVEGVEFLTLFVFSSENWRRPKTEVALLMSLFMTAMRKEIKRLHKNNVRIKFVGDRSAFSDTLQQHMVKAELMTQDNDGLTLLIAANYGGRWDILEATKTLASRLSNGEIKITDITEENFQACLGMGAWPDPDLFIRTGGEQRISNFLLWNLAYTELYFTDLLWPEFDKDALQLAFQSFRTRQRRFGMTGAQIREVKGA